MDKENDCRMFRLYAKLPNAKRFAPMDYGRGVTVGNLIYATLFSQAEADKLMAELDDLEAINPGWFFQVRPAS
tara:strand:+ start:684 stop:902 length:219 start_codon:yes stop_codon:yes gene_type:complete